MKRLNFITCHKSRLNFFDSFFFCFFSSILIIKSMKFIPINYSFSHQVMSMHRKKSQQQQQKQLINFNFSFFFVLFSRLGASKEIGTALTRVCLRHKAVETRMKSFTTAIMDCLILPLQVWSPSLFYHFFEDFRFFFFFNKKKLFFSPPF